MESKRASVVAVAVPVAVMLAIGLWGLDRGGMWGDESVTFLVGRRTVPQIWQLLHGMDAVHGLYYLLMHVVLAVHPGEVVLRLPSVCGAAATAGLVAALGIRLARPRVGLWAGLLYAVTPLTGHYAQEGRSYALVAAGAAGATLLLVRELAKPRSWWPYGCVVAVTCLLHELAVLVLCAHAVTLALARVSKAVWCGWGRAVGVVGVVLLPLVWVSQGQSGQVGWLVAPGWEQVGGLVRNFAVGPTGVVFWVAVLLMVVGVRAGRLAAVTVPLLVVPPGVLMAVSQVRPLYHERYVLYALAGAALLTAAGTEWVAGVVARLRPGGRLVPSAGVLVITLAFLQHLPLYRHDRSPADRPENLAVVSALAAREIRPGDPVLFVPSVWRLAALTYPKGFRKGRDIALGESGPRSGTLSGRETTPRRLKRELAGVDRVWVVAQSGVLRSRPVNPTERVKLAVVEGQFVPQQKYVSGRVALQLYVRRASTNPPRTPTPPPRPARS
ncbi:glycosyltransferase family 39 protein [Streptomyces sp. NPDC047043]|uniref:glycosyltransferase family 39 protein n=1 Tax=Streptomyces sp. NPDC047043 TaxID=3154497 RepID=UPI0033D62487